MSRVLFIHHSVGRHMLETGMRDLPRLADVELWDADYNRFGVRNGKGDQASGPALPGDNTNPEGFARVLLRQDAADAEYVEWMRSFDAVVLKSCYTALQLRSGVSLDERLRGIEEMFRRVSETFDKAMICTPPPLRVVRRERLRNGRVDPIIEKYRECAEKFEVRTIDLFGRLSDDTGGLKSEYRRNFFLDNHPNQAGSVAGASCIADGLLSIIGKEH